MVKGYLFALLWALMVGFFNVFFKYFEMADTNPIIVICQSMLFASFILIAFAGPGTLAKDAMKAKQSWYYGVCYLGATALFVYALEFISATQMSLLIKAAIPMSFLVAAFYFRRQISLSGWVGFLMVCVGITMVGFEVPKDYLGLIIVVVLAFSVFETLQFMLSDMHRSNKKAKGSIKDSMRVTGMVLAATSVVFLVVCLLSIAVRELAGVGVGILPTLDDFFNPASYSLAAVYGVFGLAIIRYSEFVSAREIKFEMFTAVTALSSGTTLLFEHLLGIWGFMDVTNFSVIELSATAIIIIGSANAVYARVTAIKEPDHI